MRMFLNLLLSEDGVTSVEYVTMLSLIILVMLVSISALGNSALTMWSTIVNGVNNSW